MYPLLHLSIYVIFAIIASYALIEPRRDFPLRIRQISTYTHVSRLFYSIATNGVIFRDTTACGLRARTVSEA